MGSCLSYTSLNRPTAKLVLLQEDGVVVIRDFQEPVKVAQILRESPGFFVCHADSMRYDEYVSPLSAEQQLQMEHLYFMLSVTKLQNPLTASDMAALAVKTSAAMDRSHSRSQTRRFISSVWSAEVGDECRDERSEWRNEERVDKLERENGLDGLRPCDAGMGTMRRKLRTIEEEAFGNQKNEV